VCLKSLSHKKSDYSKKKFHTRYKVGKENQSLCNFESETDLQELNRTDMGYILHSVNPYIVMMK
jgi:hypothetical protein